MDFLCSESLFRGGSCESPAWALASPPPRQAQGPPQRQPRGWCLCLPLVVASSSLGCEQKPVLYKIIIFESVNLKTNNSVLFTNCLFSLWFYINDPTLLNGKECRIILNSSSLLVYFFICLRVMTNTRVPLNCLRKKCARKMTVQLPFQTSKQAISNPFLNN